MQKVSQINNDSKVSAVVKQIADTLGIEKSKVQKIVDKRLKTVAEADIEKALSTILKQYTTEPKIYTVDYWVNQLKKHLDSETTEQGAINKLIQDLLKQSDSIDTYTLLETVKNILLLNNNQQIAKDLTIESIKETGFNEKFQKLNESIDFKFNREAIDYHSLKLILSKNNKRWGISNKVRGTYEQIMNYLNNKNSNIETEVVSLNDEFDKNVLFEFINGTVSPMNINYQINKDSIADIQTLIFDMVIIINAYLINNQHLYGYINNQKINNYKKYSEAVVTNLYSSLVNSNVVNKYYIEDILNNKFVNSARKGLIIDDLSMANIIDLAMLKLNNLYLMLNYIHSASDDFNMKLRQILINYVNNTRLMLNKINELKTKNYA